MLVEPDSSLTPFISYEAAGQRIVFSEDPASSTLVGSFPIVYVSLVAAGDVKSDYFFLVQVTEPIVEEVIPPTFMASSLED